MITKDTPSYTEVLRVYAQTMRPGQSVRLYRKGLEPFTKEAIASMRVALSIANAGADNNRVRLSVSDDNKTVFLSVAHPEIDLKAVQIVNTISRLPKGTYTEEPSEYIACCRAWLDGIEANIERLPSQCVYTRTEIDEALRAQARANAQRIGRVQRVIDTQQADDDERF